MTEEYYSQFRNLGFQVFKNFLTKKEISFYKKRIDKILKIQTLQFGKEFLASIGETNTVRSPMLYDKNFINLFTAPKVHDLVKEILGPFYILSLQNCIVVQPNSEHHQSFYHRDIIHQKFTTSKPIGVNIYYCLDDYDFSNGGTMFIPGSHRMEKLPENYADFETTPNVPAGSVILFDSMVYHKAGVNKTQNQRYGINHMFTLPFIKQQIDYPNALGKDFEVDLATKQILGYSSREFDSVKELLSYRRTKLEI